ncbi:hypothetical protein WD019_02310 [Fictibacillus sp. Mic-4]|uniref:hypothetical protein n=1 Tax=Fictibacillus sp. Mic-4 TaxID=3132826 RepID=UPI003CF735E4
MRIIQGVKLIIASILWTIVLVNLIIGKQVDAFTAGLAYSFIAAITFLSGLGYLLSKEDE